MRHCERLSLQIVRVLYQIASGNTIPIFKWINPFLFTSELNSDKHKANDTNSIETICEFILAKEVTSANIDWD